MDAWGSRGCCDARLPCRTPRARVSYGSRRVVTAGSPISDVSDARREQPLNRLSASEQRGHTDCRSRGGPRVSTPFGRSEALLHACALAAALVVGGGDRTPGSLGALLALVVDRLDHGQRPHVRGYWGDDTRGVGKLPRPDGRRGPARREPRRTHRDPLDHRRLAQHARVQELLPEQPRRVRLVSVARRPRSSMR